MGRTIKYGKGRNSVELTGEIRDWVDKAIRAAQPQAIAAIEQALEGVQDHARADWPVRAKNSKDSRGLIKIGLRVLPSSVEGFIENRAPYAWAIKAGRRSTTSVQPGKRIAVALIWRPLKAKADGVAKEIARRIKRKAG